MNRVMMQTEGHAGGLPVDDHADEREERDAAQFRDSKLCESPAILSGEVGQIVGELIQPIDAGTRGRKGLR